METEEPLRVEFGFLLGDPDPLPGWLVHLFLLVEEYREGPIFLIGNISINNNNNNNNCDRRHVYVGVNIFFVEFFIKINKK